MLILVNKNKYKELNEICESLKSERHSHLTQIEKMRNEINSLKQDLKNREKTYNRILKDDSILVESNNNLISWVKTIIHDVGSYKINSDGPIKIPIHESVSYNLNDGPIHQEEVHIPAINFITATRVGVDYSYCDDWTKKSETFNSCGISTEELNTNMINLISNKEENNE